MINKSDLRVGNYVHDGDEITTVESIGEYWINAAGGNEGWKYKDLTGVKLNDKWFLQLGFKKFGTAPFYSWRREVNSVDELAWYSQDKSLRYQTKGSGFTRPYDYQFVHQVQNLFYILNGKECIQ